MLSLEVGAFVARVCLKLEDVALVGTVRGEQGVLLLKKKKMSL